MNPNVDYARLVDALVEAVREMNRMNRMRQYGVRRRDPPSYAAQIEAQAAQIERLVSELRDAEGRGAEHADEARLKSMRDAVAAAEAELARAREYLAQRTQQLEADHLQIRSETLKQLEAETAARAQCRSRSGPRRR